MSSDIGFMPAKWNLSMKVNGLPLEGLYRLLLHGNNGDFGGQMPQIFTVGHRLLWREQTSLINTFVLQNLSWLLWYDITCNTKFGP